MFPLTPRTRRVVGSLTVATFLAAGLVACGEASDSPSGDAIELPEAEGTTSFPLTLETWQGSSTLEERPERVAVLGFSPSLDVVQSLGVTPVYYGGRNAGTDWPWNDTAITDEIGEKDEPDDDGINYEAVAASDPDLIIAFGAVLDENSYERLNESAPVLDYAEETRWDQVDWRENQLRVGEALDLGEAAESVVADADERIAAVGEEHPEFAGKTITLAYDYGPEFGVSYYTVEGGPAQGLFLDLGFAASPNAADFVDDDVVSDENQAQLDADVLVVIYTDEAVREARESQALFQAIPAVAEGRYESLVFTGEDAPGELERSDGTVVQNAVWPLRAGASVLAYPWAAEEVANNWLGGLDLS